MTATSSRPLALIQLVSEQTMPNLLPVLRLRPAKLVHLATPRTENRSLWIAAAAQQAGHEVELETLCLSTMPTVGETKAAVAQIISAVRADGLTPVLNFTGGTKLMSLGAFIAALHPAKITSFYVDTQDGKFVDGQTGPGFDDLFQGDPSFTPIVRKLAVHVVAAANGCARVTNGEDWKPYLPLADYLFANEHEEAACHEALFGKEGLLPRGHFPQKPEQWLPLLDRTFTLPPKVASIAVDLGLVIRLSESGECRLPDTNRQKLALIIEARQQKRHLANYDRLRIAATDFLARPIRLLTGSWFEITIAERLRKTGRFRDIRWSAHTGPGGQAALEEDILALDGVRIACISCKRSGRGLMGHLSELNDRTRALGGSFARPYLAISRPPTGAFLQNLRQRADELRVRLILPEDLEKPDPFAPNG